MRSMLPHLAAATLLLTIITVPFLNSSEKRLVRQDTISGVDTENGSPTALEGRVTARLRDQVNEEAEALGLLPRGLPPTGNDG